MFKKIKEMIKRVDYECYLGYKYLSQRIKFLEESRPVKIEIIKLTKPKKGERYVFILPKGVTHEEAERFSSILRKLPKEESIVIGGNVKIQMVNGKPFKNSNRR